MKNLLCKIPEGYSPANDATQRQWDRLDYGGMIEFNGNVIRSPVQHRRFFAMIGEAHKRANTDQTQDNFRRGLVFEAGFYDVMVNHMGQIYAVVQSLKYADMDNETFQAVHSRVLDMIIQTLGFDHETQLYFIQNFGVPNK